MSTAVKNMKWSITLLIIILPFIAVKPLRNNLYCMKRYINKGDLA